MRLLIVGTLKGQLTTATKLAMDKGASVTHAESIEQAMAVLRSGKGADLLMVDVALDIRDLVLRLEAERIHVPLVACGTQNDARAGLSRRRDGARRQARPADRAERGLGADHGRVRHRQGGAGAPRPCPLQ